MNKKFLIGSAFASSALLLGIIVLFALNQDDAPATPAGNSKEKQVDQIANKTAADSRTPDDSTNDLTSPSNQTGKAEKAVTATTNESIVAPDATTERALPITNIDTNMTNRQQQEQLNSIDTEKKKLQAAVEEKKTKDASKSSESTESTSQKPEGLETSHEPTKSDNASTAAQPVVEPVITFPASFSTDEDTDNTNCYPTLSAKNTYDFTKTSLIVSKTSSSESSSEDELTPSDDDESGSENGQATKSSSPKKKQTKRPLQWSISTEEKGKEEKSKTGKNNQKTKVVEEDDVQEHLDTEVYSDDDLFHSINSSEEHDAKETKTKKVEKKGKPLKAEPKKKVPEPKKGKLLVVAKKNVKATANNESKLSAKVSPKSPVKPAPNAKQTIKSKSVPVPTKMEQKIKPKAAPSKQSSSSKKKTNSQKTVKPSKYARPTRVHNPTKVI